MMIQIDPRMIGRRHSRRMDALLRSSPREVDADLISG